MLFGLLPGPAPALRVVETSVAAVPERQRVHAAQRVQRSWTVAAEPSGRAPLTRLRLECPGLTIVRVRSALRREIHANGLRVAAVVRVTSDEPRHLDAVALALKRRRRELRVGFKNRRSKPPAHAIGSLVVEIELADGAGIDELFAKAGGDVVVARGVLARCGPACDAAGCGVGLIAFDHGRLFVDEMDEPWTCCELGVGSLYGGRVYVSASQLHVRALLGSSVMGAGSVHVHAAQITTKHVKIGAIGEAGGTATLSVTDGFEADALEAFVWGSGLVAIDAAARGTGVACRAAALQVEGRGAIDASDVAVAETCDVRIRGRGHVALEAPRADTELTLDCDVCATIKSVSASGRPPCEALRDAECRVLVTASKSRVSAARPCPPTIAEAFDHPTVIRAQRAGFRERHLRPLLGFH